MKLRSIVTSEDIADNYWIAKWKPTMDQLNRQDKIREIFATLASHKPEAKKYSWRLCLLIDTETFGFLLNTSSGFRLTEYSQLPLNDFVTAFDNNSLVEVRAPPPLIRMLSLEVLYKLKDSLIKYLNQFDATDEYRALHGRIDVLRDYTDERAVFVRALTWCNFFSKTSHAHLTNWRPYPILLPSHEADFIKRAALKSPRLTHITMTGYKFDKETLELLLDSDRVITYKNCEVVRATPPGRGLSKIPLFVIFVIFCVALGILMGGAEREDQS